MTCLVFVLPYYANNYDQNVTCFVFSCFKTYTKKDMYRVIHKSRTPIAKSLLAITIIPNFAHLIMYL